MKVVNGNINDFMPDYGGQDVEIHSEVFDSDFDEAGWDPQIVEDEIDEDFANEIGMNSY